MCGIIGAYINKSNDLDVEKFNIIRDKLSYRGPDSGGTFNHNNIFLGHRRLSIIDLDTGNQPMFDAKGEISIVFNGEIYNFLTIKEELKTLGVIFKTNSDTEVILEGYLAWGLEDCLKRLEGMYAFSIWDNQKKKLFVVRDKFGEKPLYYTQDENGVYFASELKAIVPFINKTKISKKALNLFFSLTYIPAPYTIYEEVFKLEAGSYLEVNEEGQFEVFKFYDLKKIVKNNQYELITDYEVAKKQLRDLLFTSVEERMVSDVPLGSFLSGGIDSSIVSAIMAKISPEPIKTFSIGFKEKEYDESERAALVAKHIGSEHTLHILGHEDLLAVVDETLAYFDEPFGDSSAIPSMMVAKKAKEKVTVVLTGDCADELFGGYDKYLGKHYANQYNKYPKPLKLLFEKIIRIIPHTSTTNQILRKVKKVVHSAGLSPEQRYVSLSSLGFTELQKQELLKPEFQDNSNPIILKYFSDLNGDELFKTFYSDAKLVLEGDMLTKVDRACMINSLEARVPFLDSKIVDFSFKLPHNFKIHGTNKKRILKETFADLLPKETMSFSKKGFGIPIGIWFQKELKSELMGLLHVEIIKKQGIFNFDYINTILEEHMSGKENHSFKLWQLYVFQKWYNCNV